MSWKKTTRTGSVSYTHLDVYKRQVICIHSTNIQYGIFPEYTVAENNTAEKNINDLDMLKIQRNANFIFISIARYKYTMSNFQHMQLVILGRRSITGLIDAFSNLPSWTIEIRNSQPCFFNWPIRNGPIWLLWLSIIIDRFRNVEIQLKYSTSVIKRTISRLSKRIVCLGSRLTQILLLLYQFP